MVEKALAGVIQEALLQGVSTRAWRARVAEIQVAAESAVG